jgi:hypothetical protein
MNVKLINNHNEYLDNPYTTQKMISYAKSLDELNLKRRANLTVVPTAKDPVRVGSNLLTLIKEKEIPFIEKDGAIYVRRWVFWVLCAEYSNARIGEVIQRLAMPDQAETLQAWEAQFLLCGTSSLTDVVKEYARTVFK